MFCQALAFAFLLFAAAASGQTRLTLTANNTPLPGATILDGSGAPLGMTNAEGVWAPATCPGEVLQIRISAIGYVGQEVGLACGQNTPVELDPDIVTIGSATVVGSLAPMSVKQSPIRTQVLAGTSLMAQPADDAVEALDFTNGVRETVGCGVCGTNDIHINGLEGVYTLVLIDGVPLLGGLASAYALDGLPLSMIQQVEVIQGPASARFGSQAVGGVINVVLEPVENARPSFRLRQDAHGRLVSSASWGNGKGTWQWGADGLRFTRRLDENADGMTDAPTTERMVLTARHVQNADKRRVSMMLRGMVERRFGGELDFEEADRGQEIRYGERIDLFRIEGILSATPKAENRPFRALGGAAYHRQESTYGTAVFNANQLTANADLLWDGLKWGEDSNQTLRAGASLAADFYADETPASSDMRYLLPALFLEQGGARGDLSWIVGLRTEQPLDLIPDSELPMQAVLAPRVNVKWAPRPDLDARINIGRGYRRIHLFTEEHAALDGSRDIRIEGSLRPEQSWNFNGSANWTVGRDAWFADISAHAFLTRFADRLFADYNASPNSIVYRNIEGLGSTRGVGTDLTLQGRNGLQTTLGATWLRAEIDEPQGRREIEFAPRWTANASVACTRSDWQFNLQAQAVGPMRLPDVPGFDLHSAPYGLVNGYVGRTFGGRTTVRVGLKNATNTRQPTPLIAADRPFSVDFDASRVYGPIEGRRAFMEVAIRW